MRTITKTGIRRRAPGTFATLMRAETLALLLLAARGLPGQTVVVGDNNGASSNRLDLAGGDGNHYIYSTGTGGNSTYFGEYNVSGFNTGWHFIDTATGSERVTILGNGSIGIGTASPTVALDVAKTLALEANSSYQSPGGTAALELRYRTDGSNNHGEIISINRTNESGLPLTIDATNILLNTQLGGYVGIGTTNPAYLLSVNGTIQAKEVLVETGWSDYVFAADYHLQPLKDVASYIQENHHLPDIPSEADVKEKGVSLGDMQSKLLAKVEELTLHMIQAEERNNRLEQQVKSLQDRLARLAQSADGVRSGRTVKGAAQ